MTQLIERHLVSSYTEIVYDESKLIKGAKLSRTIFWCPFCTTVQGQPAHGVPGSCVAHCGLYWLVYGNLFNLSLEPIGTEGPTLTRDKLDSMIRESGLGDMLGNDVPEEWKSK